MLSTWPWRVWSLAGKMLHFELNLAKNCHAQHECQITEVGWCMLFCGKIGNLLSPKMQQKATPSPRAPRPLLAPGFGPSFATVPYYQHHQSLQALLVIALLLM